jgi:hypothetical protein
MNYKLEPFNEDGIVIKCYIPKAEHDLQFGHIEPELLFDNLHRTYLDPILQQEEEINGIAIAMKVEKWQIGEEREDGTYQLAFIGSYKKFSIEEAEEMVKGLEDHEETNTDALTK